MKQTISVNTDDKTVSIIITGMSFSSINKLKHLPEIVSNSIYDSIEMGQDVKEFSEDNRNKFKQSILSDKK